MYINFQELMEEPTRPTKPISEQSQWEMSMRAAFNQLIIAITNRSERDERLERAEGYISAAKHYHVVDNELMAAASLELIINDFKEVL